MKKFIILAIIIISLFAVSASAENAGCCCSSQHTAQNETGGLQADASFCDPNHNLFLTVTAADLLSSQTPCVDKCKTFTLPVCGNKILENGEQCDDGNLVDNDNCSRTCTNIVSGCANPEFDTAPSFISIPVRGELAIKLAWTSPCPANNAIITRCKGVNCNPDELVTQVPASLKTYEDRNVLWNEQYTYGLKIEYQKSKTSKTALSSTTPGDIECGHKTDASQFCVTDRTYYDDANYLKTNGYTQSSTNQYSSPDLFGQAFASVVSNVFAGRLNKGWSCTSANKLTATPTSCQSTQVCASSTQGIQCKDKSICKQNGLFGLFNTPQSCESGYCFLDKSSSVVDKCYQCSSLMTCADYRSKNSCQRNNCQVGSCQWTDTLPSLGIGVCADTRTSNCDSCDYKGFDVSPNKEAFNQIFDRCTEQKAAALSTPTNPCFFSKDFSTAKGCDKVSCRDYSPQQCSSSHPVILNPDNTVESGSTDSCGLKICEYSTARGCYKNADGQLDSTPDCALDSPNYINCESDVVPPTTTLDPKGDNRTDILEVRVFDKNASDSTSVEVTGTLGVKTFVCVDGNNGTSCTDPKTFKQITTKQLLLQNLDVMDGDNVIGSGKDGISRIRFFSKDASNNPEVVKTAQFTACAACSPPIIRNISVDNGNLVDGTFHTSKAQPKIKVTFSAPVSISFLSLKQGSDTVSIQQSPAASSKVFTFTPATALTGDYILTLNAKNANGIALDKPVDINFVVDTTLATLSILPQSGSEFTDDIVELGLAFSEQVKVQNVSLLTQKSQLVNYNRELTTVVKSDDNATFTYTIPIIGDGKHTLTVSANDLAGNPVIGQAVWYKSTNSLGILLSQPKFGGSPTTSFNFEVETTGIAECKYIKNVINAPPANKQTFDVAAEFDSTNAKIHNTAFNVPDGQVSKTAVICQKGANYTVETFNLFVDTTPPKILSASASPNPVSEPISLGAQLFETNLKVQLDKPGFCRYSGANTKFDEMEGRFPGYGEAPKLILSAPVQVGSQGSQKINVACVTTGIPSQTMSVPFSINTGVTLDIKSTTRKYWNNSLVSFGIETNKKSYCYLGPKDAITECMGDCAPELSHVHEIDFENETTAVFYAQCAAPSTGEQSKLLQINISIDSTPPVMDYVDDLTSLPYNPELWYEKDRLFVAFLGKDNQSSISAYQVMLRSVLTGQPVFDWTTSLVLDGKPTPFSKNITNTTFLLEDKQKYFFAVKALNRAGSLSSPMASDGVSIDLSLKPEQCANGLKDSNETSVDCGGGCGATCGVNATCKVSSDCESNSCVNALCQAPSCNDSISSIGFETDVDCGESCSPCALDKSCLTNTDCASNSCVNAVCVSANSCDDGILTENSTESDLDCGGSCSLCDEGKNCNSNNDCNVGLECDSKLLCVPTAGDSDRDGVLDEVDLCFDTPSGETVDDTGCGLSQKSSLNDGISDKWRMDNFGCIECEEAAANADGDNDGLTNAGEFEAKTDPKNPDSDGDGWNDNKEVNSATDPLDPLSHPAGFVSALLWTLLWLLIIGLAGLGGYLLYNLFVHRKTEFEKLEFKSDETNYQLPSSLMPKPEEIGEIKKETEDVRLLRLRQLASGQKTKKKGKK